LIGSLWTQLADAFLLESVWWTFFFLSIKDEREKVSRSAYFIIFFLTDYGSCWWMR
jgi:hypothetical protein